MSYYLISKKNEYSICFVKDKDSEAFIQQCKQKILVHGCNILKLLSLLDEELVTRFPFSNN